MRKRSGRLWASHNQNCLIKIPEQVQFLPNQIGTGRSFLSGPLSTAAGESPSEPAALKNDFQRLAPASQ
jgi:hypothetical protein